MNCKNCYNYNISDFNIIKDQNDYYIILNCKKCMFKSKYLIPEKDPPTKKSIHLPGYLFCGPYTDVYNALKQYHYVYVNNIDKQCLLHDIRYYLYSDKKIRQKADYVFYDNISSMYKNKSFSIPLIKCLIAVKKILNI